jgi:hypothetical protein
MFSAERFGYICKSSRNLLRLETRFWDVFGVDALAGRTQGFAPTKFVWMTMQMSFGAEAQNQLETRAQHKFLI